MSRLSSTVKLAKFNSRKRRGDISRVYDEFDGFYSYSHVGNVLSGRRNNEEILSTGYRIASRRLDNINLLV